MNLESLVFIGPNPLSATPYLSDAVSRKGILLMLGAVISFGIVGAIAKWLSRDFDTVELVFFRNLVGVLFVLSSIAQRPLQQTGGRPGLLIFRGVIGTLSLYLYFYAVQALGLGPATTYQYTYPIFLALLSWLVVGETLNRREWLAIAAGFVGILLIFRPDLLVPLRNHAIGISNAILTAVAYLAIRQLSTYYDTRTIVLSFMLSGLVMPLISMSLGTYFPHSSLDFLLGTFRWPTELYQWLGLLALGVIALVGQVLLTQAFTYDKAGRVAAVGYTNILFAALLGQFIGDPFPDLLTLLGMALIIGGGLLVSLRPRR
ncbi:DMT family transporter [Rhabdobacter roseus]|uniref:Drug/metabolite transporter (DMT)-like permease n=1 Tax=Rhabdobacter roseus TaxID=1655419 RepID=A0A840TQJ7_9BACT|nr:DMT family transporter [Rhabdobacter roseus]MBB5282278.1 drug/metabolite transporter (DMT)-like permease [Rhabdobacter roseus]